jgi:hypothetical protein
VDSEREIAFYTTAVQVLPLLLVVLLFERTIVRRSYRRLHVLRNSALFLGGLGALVGTLAAVDFLSDGVRDRFNFVVISLAYTALIIVLLVEVLVAGDRRTDTRETSTEEPPARTTDAPLPVPEARAGVLKRALIGAVVTALVVRRARR